MKKGPTLFGLSLLCLGILIWGAPHWSRPLRQHYSLSQVVLDNKGNPLRLTLSQDDKYRLWIPLKEINQDLVKITLLKEDRGFFYHPGVNPFSLGRALYTQLMASKGRSGGSTITMQLAKLHYQIYTKSLWGKTKQMTMALWLELLYSKEDILEAYLNLAPYGRNIEGIGAASLVYFHKLPRDLVPSEALFLSVIPQAPNTMRNHQDYHPPHPQLQKTMQQLYQKWLTTLPNKTPYENIFNPMPSVYPLSHLPFLAPHFTDEVLWHSRQKQTIIHTTLDLSFQRLLEKLVRTYVERRKIDGIENAAAMIIDYHSMEAKALVGSVDFFNRTIQGQVNGTRAKRSPGSTLKPFLYALALEKGIIHNQSLLYDAPLKIETPENFDQTYMGPISAEEALIHSRNIPAVDLASRFEGASFYDFLKISGISSLKPASHYGLSLVLGGAELTMEELVKLYSMLANNGVLRPLQKIKGSLPRQGRKVLTQEGAVMVKDMLKKNPRPGGAIDRHFLKEDVPVYWKTGTSWGFRDAWSVGFVGPYVIAVWVGNFNGSSHPAFVGLEAAAPLFFEIVDALRPSLYKDMELQHNFASQLTEVEVCTLSGALPNPHCPHLKKTLFFPGVSPIDKCQVHREVLIEKKSGLRACWPNKDKTTKKVFEFWPTHVLKIFQQKGLTRKLPPPYTKECLLSQRNLGGRAPVVLSPQLGLTYHMRVDKGPSEIALEAQVDADTKELYWYIEGELVARARPTDPVFWKARPGEFEIQVVDDLGRASSRNIKVVLLQ